ncbi:VanW family protein [Cellulomonas sp. PhB143]|uniref:VanW family protein n=1 Tax=Cellulomonas sp. PhB143 TaxID=2485186 RepID=UPI000FB49136|nr:VanW family protein [Cellulomonas sp. PhB143]ROS76925.1 vancomycin resistance protein YoaR [Cellulomonas sp. PhB143]
MGPDPQTDPQRVPEGTSAEHDPSLLSGVGAEPAPSRVPKVALWAGIGVVVLAGLYVGAQWALADTVPTGTTVAGVDVGGQSSAEAKATLDDQLGPVAREPLPVELAGTTTSIDPAASGLTLDTRATADALTSFSLRPQRLWEQVFGGTDRPPVVHVDPDELRDGVEGAAKSVDVAPVDGTVTFSGDEARSTEASAGTSVDVDAAAATIRTKWLVTEPPIVLPSHPTEPDVTQDETDAALAVAQQVVSAPVVVEVGGQRAELPPDALGDSASFPAKDGDLALTWDEDALVAAVDDRTKDLESSPKDAHFVFVDAKPVIRGGTDGASLDPDALTKAVDAAATSDDDRTATTKLVPVEPEHSKADLSKLGVKDRIVEFSTPLTDDAVRTQNLRVGAAHVDGTLVEPGKRFSVTDALSPITPEAGYGQAHVVTDGRTTDAIGGGLSQMATNTYNIGFLAGYESITHKPHSYWYDRYPAGRESTMYIGQIDMVWENDTPFGVLLQAWVSGGRLHTAAWSTKYWTVTSHSGPHRDVVPTTTTTDTSAGCTPQSAGNDGFTITVDRKVSRAGKVDKDEHKTWTYQPENAVVCK